MNRKFYIAVYYTALICTIPLTVFIVYLAGKYGLYYSLKLAQWINWANPFTWYVISGIGLGLWLRLIGLLYMAFNYFWFVKGADIKERLS